MPQIEWYQWLKRNLLICKIIDTFPELLHPTKGVEFKYSSAPISIQRIAAFHKLRGAVEC